MMDVAFSAFTWLSALLGAIGMITAVLWGLGWALVLLWKYLKVWHVLALAVGVQVHGKEYRDQLFWQAIRERVESGGGEAQRIADYALKHKPKDDEGM